jgi:HK97 family phage portal protein
VAILKRKTDAPKPAVGAARGYAPMASSGMSMVDKFTYYTASPSVEAALSIPTISRARDLICSMIGCLRFTQYTYQWNGENMERVYVQPDTWFEQPDPNVTRNFILSNTASDLLMFGRAFWIITERLGNGFPSKFTWVPAQNVYTLDQPGPQWFGPSNQITFQGATLDTRDVVQFLSPNGGLIYQGVSAITTTLRLQKSAERFATNEIPSGYLKQTGGETMTAQDLADMAAAFAQARQNSTVAALNEYVDYKETSQKPDDLQLVQSREFQALEMARLANIPPYLVGVSVPGYTYMNADSANRDLYMFGAKPLISCIEQTLSMNSIIPRGRYVELDVSAYLEENREAYGENGADDEERPTGGGGGGASNVADNPSSLPARRVR